MPDYDSITHLPYFDTVKQHQIILVRQTNTGINNKAIIFYSKRKDAVAYPKKVPACNEPERINPSGMARTLGMGRSRLYQLIKEGIFPSTSRDSDQRPYFTKDQQAQILAVYKNNVGINGKSIFFNPKKINKTNKNKHIKTSTKKIASITPQIRSRIKWLKTGTKSDPPQHPKNKKVNHPYNYELKASSGVYLGEKDQLMLSQFVKAQKLNLKHNTLKAICEDTRRFMLWINEEKNKKVIFNEITTQDVVDFQVYLCSQVGFSISTVNRNLVLVRKFFGWLEDQEGISKNPASKVKEMHSTKTIPEVIDQDKLDEIIKEIEKQNDPRFSSIFHLILETGCTTAELTKLDFSDISENNVSFGDKDNKLTLPLSPNCLGLLSDWLERRPPTESTKVFIGCRGPLTQRGFNAIFDKYSDILGVDISAKLIRDTFTFNKKPIKIKQGFVYIICEDIENGPTKIGISKSPQKRVSTLQTGNYRKLIIYEKMKCENMITFEKFLHKQFESFHLSGEWFDIKPNDASNSIKKYLEMFIK